MTSIANEVTELASALIAKKSVTPNDAGCQPTIAAYLANSGFSPEYLNKDGVTNLWLTRGKEQPLFVFAGHTDVVPPGNTDSWQSEPFTASIRDGLLYGRGACDMKGAVAAFAVACREFVSRHPKHKGSIAILLTSDEEGEASNGTRFVVEKLSERNLTIDYCLVGEPSSKQSLGDELKVGRRGSCNARLTVHGQQGHVAYPHLVDNPIHNSLKGLNTLAQETWDHGTPYFPPTSFQMVRVHADGGALNIVPNDFVIDMNWRFCPAVTPATLEERTRAILNREQLKYTLDFAPSSDPFFVKPAELVGALQASICKVTGLSPKNSTDGGTSDGRFLASISKELAEFGLPNATIHKANESAKLADLHSLTCVYTELLELLLGIAPK